MPIIHIYSKEQPLRAKYDSNKPPEILHIRGALVSIPTGLDILQGGTLTDITPPCFKFLTDKEILPDARFMADVASDGESARIQLINVPGLSATRQLAVRETGVEPGDADTGSITAAGMPEIIIGHQNELGAYIGGLVMHLPEHKIELFTRLYGA